MAIQFPKGKYISMVKVGEKGQIVIPKGARDADYEKARRAYLVEYERSIPELRQAERCTGCGVCLKHCPQMIPIPEEMARLGKFVENLRTRQG